MPQRAVPARSPADPIAAAESPGPAAPDAPDGAPDASRSVRLVLPEAVRLVPVTELAEDTRSRIDCPDDHVAVTRIGSRTSSTVVDPEAAALLERFRQPRTLVEALILYARPRGLDPTEMLDDALELVERFARARFLEPEGGATGGGPAQGDGATRDEAKAGEAGSTGSNPAKGLLARGARIVLRDEAGEALETVRAVEPVAILEDVEVVLVRREKSRGEPRGGSPPDSPWAALKIRRPEAPGFAPFAHEAEILRHLDGAGGAPRLLATGAAVSVVDDVDGADGADDGDGAHGVDTIEDREFLLLEWCPGLDAETAAAELRRPQTPSGGRGALAALLLGVARAYAKLHGRGVLHGDVHPRNLFVDRRGAVRILDFGLARRLDQGPEAGRRIPRGGVGFFFEPEWARAIHATGRPAAPSPAGEQYAVAALLYLLATGVHRQDFSLGRDEMIAELAEVEPLPFAERGVAPWPELEEVLGRALALEPGERYPSMDGLVEALEAVVEDLDLDLEAAEKTGFSGVPEVAATSGRVSEVAVPKVPGTPGEVVPEPLRRLEAELLERLGWTSLWGTSSASGDPSPKVPGTDEPSTDEPKVPGTDEAPPDWLAAGLPLAPTASVKYGAAGVALGLLRMAGARGDHRLLALAERWCERAEATLEVPGEVADDGVDDGAVDAGSEPDPDPDTDSPPLHPGFHREDIEIVPAVVGEGSPFHSPTGIHAVRAFLARAQGDMVGLVKAVDAYLRAAEAPVKGLDVTLGRGSLVLVTAHLLEALPAEGGAESRGLAKALGLPRGAEPIDREPLLRLGREHLEAIWSELDAMPSIPEAPVDTLGAAHGWAGFLHLAFEWSRVTGDPLPEAVPERLEQLAAEARPHGRGVRWPWQNPDTSGTTMPGWCNGSAGAVPLWLAAAERLGEERYRELAEAAAWHCWESPDPTGSLCCGLTGRAWALLAMYRATAEPVWWHRARALAERAAAQGRHQDEYPWSLYKGSFGAVVLGADLEAPAGSGQPFFEGVGW